MPKAHKKSAAPAPTVEALQAVVDDAAGTATLPAKEKKPAKAAKKKADDDRPAPEPKNIHAAIRAAMPDARPPEKKPAKPAAKAEKPADEEIETVEEDDDPIVGEFDEPDDREDDRPPRRKDTREDRRDEDEPEDLDEDAYELAEQSGLTRKEAREQAAEVGGAAAFKAAMKLALKQARNRSPDREDDRPPKRRTREDDDDLAAERDEPEHAAREDEPPAPKGKLLEKLLAKLDLSPDEYSEAGIKLAEVLASRQDGHTKAIVAEVERLLEKVSAIETRANQQAAAEMRKTLDAMYKAMPTEFADTYGKVPTYRLPQSSPLLANRMKFEQKMSQVQRLRIQDGEPPLDWDELREETLDLLHRDRREERVRNKIANEDPKPRGNVIPRANSRTVELPPGREKAQRKSLEKQREYGLIA